MYVPCFCRVLVMEARVEENKKCWENKKCCWSTSRRRVIPQLFRVLPNFHECFYNSIETKRTQFFLCGENFIMLLILNLPNFLMSSFTGLIIVYFFPFDRNLLPIPRNFQTCSLEDYGQVFGGLTSRAPH